MFFILSKIFDVLLMPLVWVLFILIWGIWRKRSRIASIWAIILLLLLSNEYLCNQFYLQWEVSGTEFAALDSLPTAEYAVVLSGVMNNFKAPYDRFHTNKGADRVLHTALLYQKGYINNVVVSGKYVRPDGSQASEAENIKALLQLCGVANNHILMESQARNTRENARFTAALLAERQQQKPVLLVTSAFHMRRARASFEKTGLKVIPFATDFYSIDSPTDWKSIIVPSAVSFQKNTHLIREIAGFLVYKILGYA